MVEINLNSSRRREPTSFLASLVTSLSFMKQVADQTGKPTNAAQVEILRQISQVGTKNGGNPISGAGATKSGSED